MLKLKRCPCCGIEKPYHHFYTKKDGCLSPYCRPCDSKKSKERYRLKHGTHEYATPLLRALKAGPQTAEELSRSVPGASLQRISSVLSCMLRGRVTVHRGAARKGVKRIAVYRLTGDEHEYLSANGAPCSLPIPPRNTARSQSVLCDDESDEWEDDDLPAFHDAEHDEWAESIQRRKRERERMRQVLLGQSEQGRPSCR